MASRRNVSEVRVRFSKSLSNRRQRPRHTNVRSTIHRFGRITKPFATSERLTISSRHAPMAATAVGENTLDEREQPARLLQQRQGAISILHVGRMNVGGEDQAERVDHNVALLALDLPASIVADRSMRAPLFQRSSRSGCQRSPHSGWPPCRSVREPARTTRGAGAPRCRLSPRVAGIHAPCSGTAGPSARPATGSRWTARRTRR